MKLYIEQGGDAPKKIAGFDTRVFLVDENDNKIDISNMVRAAHVHLESGSVVTADLEVFVTGVRSRAEVETLFVRQLKPRRFWHRKWRDITGMRIDGAREYA